MSRTLCRSLAPVLLGLLVLACSSPAPPSGPTEAVEQFYRHLNAGNFGKAKALYSAEARSTLADPDSASDEGFAQWAGIETKDGKVDEVRVTQEDTQETQAVVEYEIVYKDGTRATRSVKLTMEDGEWRLGLIG